ncbi:MAG: SH3 domain-containing protein [Rickettsiales bacterium]|nr:SH3 domain-containing protein [Rickettsiales bacterium]
MLKNFATITFLILLSFASNAEDIKPTGLPLPRFASLASKEANVRTGPGKRYPIKWVLVRKNIPLEITEEYEHWRKVRDIQGDEGWIHKSQLSGKRTAIIKNNNSKLYSSESAESSVKAVLQNGVVVEIDTCKQGFCNVEASDVSGYIETPNIWGVYFGEDVK